MDCILIPEGDQSSARTSVRTLVSIINDQRKRSFYNKTSNWNGMNQGLFLCRWKKNAISLNGLAQERLNVVGWVLSKYNEIWLRPLPNIEALVTKY